MFIGHFGIAFAAKRAAPAVSLGTLFAAAQLADLVWPVLVLTGIEVVAIDERATVVTPLDFVHYPYSHSLVALIVWGALFGGAYALLRRARVSVAATLAIVVLSHWILDWITHRPDMPLTLQGTERFGLGLWNSLPATLLVEFALLGTGVALYARMTAAKDRIGSVSLWALVAFLSLIQIANAFAPAPPSPVAVAWTALSMWLLVASGYWIDGHRMPRRPS
jgi:membrane-bound metal-dependent hydrolase YbcI (DUF457 family)